MSTNIGIVGIGKMGLPVALSLLEHGFAVSGYRRHMSADFMSRGGTPLASSKEVAQHCDIVLTCLPTDRALLEVVEGEQGLVHGVHPGLVVVEISMLSLQAKEQARTNLQRAGVTMLDCPRSGDPQKDGLLWQRGRRSIPFLPACPASHHRSCLLPGEFWGWLKDEMHRELTGCSPYASSRRGHGPEYEGRP